MENHQFTLSGCNLTAEHFHGLKSEITEGDETSPSGHRTKMSEKLQQEMKHFVEQRETSSEQDWSEDESDSDESEMESCTIEVTGVKNRASSETVKKYFSNRRRSGGGDIESMWYDEENSRYTITFEDREGKLINWPNSYR